MEYGIYSTLSHANSEKIINNNNNNNNNNNIWSANRPFSQSETELWRAQLNEVGPKELCCRLSARPLTTTHVWPRSTAPQPDGIGRESILRREENRSTRRKTLGVRLRSTETQPTYDPRPELNPGHRGGRHGWWPLNHPDSPKGIPSSLKISRTCDVQITSSDSWLPLSYRRLLGAYSFKLGPSDKHPAYC